jgi:hypothetical protein
LGSFQIIIHKGIEPSALWEDFKIYFLHLKSFDKIAIVGQSVIIEKIANLAGPFVSGEVKYFKSGKTVNASDWLEK